MGRPVNKSYGVGTFAEPGKGTENAAEQAMIESQ
jgi:hypothetical protein